jgi:hypothetical protein
MRGAMPVLSVGALIGLFKFKCIFSENVYSRSEILRFLQWLLKSEQHLWSSGQSLWLQIQRSGFDSLRYQIF